ncbi:septation protein IspZ [Candidatus Kaiserbacteria bacterium]|nr:MAG: septation protein IspZ [Candidatus Kaiserbacteria bacterium]
MKKHSHIWKILIFDMFVIEFGPVGVFFVAYYLFDFLKAALALGAATLVALVLSQFVNKRVPWFAIFSGSITILTALLTYIFTAPWILIIKDSVYYGLFALFLGVSLWQKKSLFKTFFGHIFAITEEGWRILEGRWFIFFVFSAVSNELVRMFLSADEWVLYKQAIVFVFLGFGLYQFRVSMKHRLPEADAIGLRKLYNN